MAKWMYPAVVMENVPESRPMGLCVHISKKDVRDFRKDNPNIKSHREGLRLLTEEAKLRIAGAIGRGMMERGVVLYDVKKTLYVADVSGVAYVYGGKKESEDNKENA